MAKKLTIEVLVRNAQATAALAGTAKAAAAATAAVGGIGTATAKAVGTIKTGMDDLQNSINAGLRRMSAATERELGKQAEYDRRMNERRTRENNSANNKIIRDNDRAAKQSIKESNEACDARTKALEKETAATEKETIKKRKVLQKELDDSLKEATAKNKKYEKMFVQLYTKEEAVRRAANEKIRRMNDEMVASELKVMGVEGRRFKNGWEGANMLKDGVVGVVSQFTALASVSAILGYIKEGFNDASAAAMEAGNFTTSYREALLELAALKGTLGNTTPELKEQLVFRSKTLQSKDQAKTFQEEYLNVSQAATDDAKTGRKGNISAEESKKLMEKSGAFQAAEGGNAGAHAKLAGMIPSLMGRRTDAAESFAEEQKLYKISQLGGATFSNFAEGYAKNATYAKTGIISKEKLAALESALSVSNTTGHAEETDQFIRATAGNVGKLKGSKSESPDAQKVGPYYRGLATKAGKDIDKLDPIEIGKLVSADLSEQEAAGKNTLEYLGAKGIGNTEDRKALLHFHGLNKSGEYAAYEKMADTKADATEAERDIKTFQDVDPVAQKRKGDIGGDLAKAGQGVGKNEFYNNLTKNAYNKLVSEGKVTDVGHEKVMSADFYDLVNGSRRRLVEGEAADMMEREANRVGLKMTDKGMDSKRQKGVGYSAWTHAGRAEQAWGEAQAITEKGGNANPGLDELVKLTQKQLELGEKQLELQRQASADRQKAQPLPVNVAPGGMGRPQN